MSEKNPPNCQDVLVAVNRANGTNHMTLDVVSDRELMIAYAALLITLTDAKVFLCNPKDGEG